MTATASEEDTARAESYLIEYNHHACHITEFGAAPEVATPRPSDVRALAAEFAAVRAPLLERMAKLEAVAELSRQLVVSAILVGPTLYYDANRLGAALHALDALTTAGNDPNPRAWACCGHPERNHNGSCSGIGSCYGIANGVHCGCTVTVDDGWRRGGGATLDAPTTTEPR